MKNRLTAIGDLLPLAAGVGLLGGAAWLLWDGSAARQETAPPPGQVAANIGPIGSVRVAEPEPTPSATAATPPPAVPVEPAEQDSAPETDTAAASVDATAAAREPEPPPTAPPPAPAPAVSAAEQAAPAPERPAQGPSETAATNADSPHRASVQAEPGKDRETSRPQVPPPAPVAPEAPEAPEAPPGAAAALELMPDPYGWHGTYVHTPHGITLFPHRIGSPGIAAAAPGVRRGMFWTTPEGKVYFEPAPGTPSATGTPPPPGRR